MTQEAAIHHATLATDELIGEADVYAPIGGRAEGVAGVALPRNSDGKATGQDAAQVDHGSAIAREIVLEIEREVVGRTVRQGRMHRRLTRTVDRLAGLHKREADPRIGAGDELAEELRIPPDDVASRAVLAIVADLDVVHRVGIDAAEVLVIDLGREFEVAAADLEAIIASEDEVDGALGFQIAVEAHDGIATGVLFLHTQFLVEGRLRIESSGEA